MSEDARTYQCPNCGGPTPEAARRCEYCAAPVATARCGHCFQMSPQGARHCSGCGRELGLSPLAQAASAECLTCRVAMSALREASGALLDCSSCGGQFVEHALLRSLLEHHEQLGRAVPRRSRPDNPLLTKVVYRPCPLCGLLMHRRNFGDTSGVIVDTCAVHGVWFDSGELARVLAFVETGGLERARSRQAERDVAQRLVTSRASLGADSDLGAGDLRTAARELLDFVITSIKNSLSR